MTRLEKFIDRLMTVADRRNLAPENPITIMIDVGNSQFYTVVSHVEPNHVTLPLNVTWVVADPESPHYLKALRRASALPFDGYRNTWAELRTYEDFEEEPQFWDLSATFQFGEVQVTGVQPATETMRGIFSLNREPLDPLDPVVVSHEDPRMDNERQPLPHTHPLFPASMLEGSTGINEFFVHIEDGKSPRAGEALMLTGENAEDGSWNGLWRAVEVADIVYDGPTVNQLVINGPTDGNVDEGTPVPFTVDAEFSDGSILASIPASWEIIANKDAGTISTSTGVFTSEDVSGDQVVRVRATWRHDESGEQHTATYDLTVVDNTVTAILESIELSGATELNEGGVTTAYTVTAFYDDGTSRGVTPTTFTSSNSAAGTLNGSTGIFTSSVDVLNNQTTTLAVTYTEAGVTKSDSVDLTVIDVTVYPMSAVIVGPVRVSEGTEETYILDVTFTDLTTSQVAVSDWAISNSAAGSIDPTTGVLTAPPEMRNNETAVLSASYTSNGRSVSATLDIDVTDETVYPLSAVISGVDQVDEDGVTTYQFMVTFSDETTSAVAVSDWALDDTSLGTIGAVSGEFVAEADVGTNLTGMISASYTQAGETVTASKAITVRDITNYPVSVEIVGSSTMGEGKAQTLVLEVTYQDSTVVEKTAESWSSSDTDLLAVNATGDLSATNGLTSDQTAIITATYTEHGVTLSDDLTITVTDDTIYPVSAIITGPETVNENTTVTYALEVTFQGGTKRVEAVDTFSIDNAALGTITSDGRLTAPSNVVNDVPGTVSASYTLDGVTVDATLAIRVTDETVYPASARIIGPTEIDEDTVHDYLFEVTFSDASVSNVAVTNWASSSTSTATIGASTGQLTALSLTADSSTTLTASYTAFETTVSASLDVVVEDITVYPVSAVVLGAATIAEGSAALTYELEVSFSDNTKQVMPAEWSHSNPNVGTLASSTGVFQPVANVIDGDKTTTIEGEYSVHGETVRATLLVTVTDETAYPVSASLNGPVQVDEEQTASYTLRVVFDDTSVLDVPAEDFASSNPAAGTIDPTTGIFTAAVNDTRANVTTTISASWDVDGTVVSDSLNIGVVDTTIYIESVAILGPDTIEESEELTYGFEVTYANGTSEVVTAYDWRLDNTTAAYIEAATGVLTASSNITSDRTVTLSASYDDDKGVTHGQTKVITVVDTIWRPVALAVNGPDSILENGSATYSAIVTYDNGNSATVAITNWLLDPAEFGAFTGAELIAAEVEADESATITCSYTENGATAYGTKTITIENIYPTQATIAGPATFEGGETQSFGFSVKRSDGSDKFEQIDSWSIVEQNDVDGNPIVIPASMNATTGELVTEAVTEDFTLTITGSYTEGMTTVTAELEIVLQAEVLAPPVLPKWGYGPYTSPTMDQGVSGPQALIDSLVNELPNNESGNTFTYDLVANQYAYIAYPKAMGTATFTDMANSFVGGWDGATWFDDYSNMEATGPVEVTYDGGNGPEQWYVYRTDWPGPTSNSLTFRIDFSGV